MTGLPDTVYVFVNFDDPVVRHNVDTIGSIISPAVALFAQDDESRDRYLRNEVDWLPFVPNPASGGFLSFFSARSATPTYRVEYEAERVRRMVAPDAQSRLSAVYAFADEAACNQVAQRHGWDRGSVREFKPVVVLRAVRYNMEIVSFMRTVAYSNVMIDEPTSHHLWASY